MHLIFRGRHYEAGVRVPSWCGEPEIDIDFFRRHVLTYRDYGHIVSLVTYNHNNMMISAVRVAGTGRACR